MHSLAQSNDLLNVNKTLRRSEATNSWAKIIQSCSHSLIRRRRNQHKKLLFYCVCTESNSRNYCTIKTTFFNGHYTFSLHWMARKNMLKLWCCLHKVWWVNWAFNWRGAINSKSSTLLTVHNSSPLNSWSRLFDGNARYNDNTWNSAQQEKDKTKEKRGTKRFQPNCLLKVYSCFFTVKFVETFPATYETLKHIFLSLCWWSRSWSVWTSNTEKCYFVLILSLKCRSPSIDSFTYDLEIPRHA